MLWLSHPTQAMWFDPAFEFAGRPIRLEVSSAPSLLKTSLPETCGLS
jgi:hypothetical protein